MSTMQEGLERHSGPRLHVRGTLGRVWTLVGPFAGLVVIAFLFATLPASSERFMTWDNWRTIAVQTVIVGTCALGMTIVMIAGGIDLAVGSTVALVTVGIVQISLQSWSGLTLALIGGILLGGACGFLNGRLITSLGVVPFIVTLGSLKVFRGLAKWWSGSTSVYAFGPDHPRPDWLARLLSSNLDPPGWLATAPGPIRELSRLAPGVWVLLGLSVLVALMLRYSLLGRHLYAVGSSEATARLCGVNVDGVKIVSYTLAGLATGLAGVMQFAYMDGTGDPTAAEGLELRVIAAVVIGGGSLSGGEGSVLGTLIGCLIMTELDSGCTLAAIPNASQDILIGAIIVVAVALDQFRRNPRPFLAFFRTVGPLARFSSTR